MVLYLHGEARRGFYKSLGDDPFIRKGAEAIRLGLDPYAFLDQENDDYLIRIAMLNKALELDDERLKFLAEAIGVYVGNRVAEIFSKVF